LSFCLFIFPPETLGSSSEPYTLNLTPKPQEEEEEEEEEERSLIVDLKRHTQTYLFP